MVTASDAQFARAFAPLLEVVQRGSIRAATPADVLEILGTGGRRYVLRGRDGRYLAKDGSGWTEALRGAIVIDDREDAKEAKAMGLATYGVHVKVVRLRRKGTLGITAVRLRPGIDVRIAGEELSLVVGKPEAMDLLAALTGGKGRAGEA